jgi:uncharacterized membrane protein (UPF0182 family)
MRVMTEQVHQGSKRWGVFLLGALAILVALVLAAEAFSAVWSDHLWFHFLGLGEVWASIAWTKAGLVGVFSVVAFSLAFVSLLLVDKIVPRALFLGPETELVRRYHHAVGRHALAVRIVVSILLAIALGAGAEGQWQHWLLYEHAVPFGKTDPLFHLDDSFFVFRLPFLSFLVGWLLVTLLVVFVVSLAAHFLNGTIRFHAQPRIEPRAIAHLSLLLGAMALVRAWGYYYVDRYRLELSSNGVVAGAGYTDVHVRLPALTLLAIVSLAAFALLVVNAYHRSLTLPAIAIGLWALLALVIGVIYPAAVQAFQVNPSQASLEKPYIERNIESTRYSMGVEGVRSQPFAANSDLTPAVLAKYRSTLEDVQLWDPSVSMPTFENLQRYWPYFSLTALSVDRYHIDGSLRPVVITVRRLNPGGSGSSSWVNLHLQYTHGYGVVVAASNEASAAGLPVFDAGMLPPIEKGGVPRITQPDVYVAPGESGYVIVNTTQAEIDYQASGTTRTSHYQGSGGVPLSSWLTRAVFALRLKDFNLLISNDITRRSRLFDVLGVRARVQKALPFLTVDATPYPVIDHGHIDWIVDAYTTSDSFPYAQRAITSGLPTSSPLAGSYNYIRDAVKVVVNAYTGKMRFYAIDAPGDPLMQAYERAFPGLFQPLSAMSPTLRAHLRYPQQLLVVQGAMYGRYHVSSASQLYSGSDAWDLAQTSTSTSGSPSQPLLRSSTGLIARYQPIYELVQLSGASSPSFEAVEPLVPASPDGQELSTLSAILFAGSSAKDYGQLEALVSTRADVEGPGLANAEILHDPAIAQEIARLDHSGSSVMLGTVQLLPIGSSLLYVRPLYVSSRQTRFPELVDVILLYNKDIAVEPTLAMALRDVVGTSAGVSGVGVAGERVSVGITTPASPPLSPLLRSLVDAAASRYAAAQQALDHGRLGAYQRDVEAAAQDLAKAKELLVPKKATASARDSIAAGVTPGAGSSAKATRAASVDRSSLSAVGSMPGVSGSLAGESTKVGAIEPPVPAVSGTPTDGAGASSG